MHAVLKPRAAQGAIDRQYAAELAAVVDAAYLACKKSSVSQAHTVEAGHRVETGSFAARRHHKRPRCVTQAAKSHHVHVQDNCV